MSIALRNLPARLLAAIALCAVLFVAAAASAAEQDVDGSSFRVFLRDGTAVAAFGDIARVGDRVIFSMRIGSSRDGGQVQVVNLPASSVDVAKTEEYSVAVRAARYATTSGEADYAQLTADVARALNQVASTNSALERLMITERIRGVVATWSAGHYGYRAQDVRQILALLDESVSDLRAEAGITQFDLNLVAGVEPPPAPALPRPTLAEAIEQSLRVAKASDVPADRIALLRTVLRVLDGPWPGTPHDWASRTREAANRALADEVRIERAYRDLSRRTLARALEAAAHADTEGVEEVLGDIRARDQRLGKKRPDEVASLTAAVQGQLDAARRLRLARDKWQMQMPALREYQDLVARPMQELRASRKALESIRRLSGPDPRVLQATRGRLERAEQMVRRITPPDAATQVHATLASACQMAVQSADARRRAVQSGDLQLAWDASSAAAGAMMLLAQARDQLQAALRPPELK